MPNEFFDYDLPPHLIAQDPASERDQSRLLLVERGNRALTHHLFLDLPSLLHAGDLLVLNDTRVLPARLLGRRVKTGGKWEGLFLHELAVGEWELMCQSGGRPSPGETIEVTPGPLRLQIVRKTATGHWIVRPEKDGAAPEILRQHGQIPLPPYIRKGIASPHDATRYQTLFARRPGAIAAPTAGLHFTPHLLEQCERRGIARTFVTLHVGAGTFQPIQVEDYRQHRMHEEWGELSADAAEAIAQCRSHGGRVIAVGTTSVRVLETVAANGFVRPWSGYTDLFIYPPYQFKAVDALITNFHLPKSTLLLLVSAFAGASLIREAYNTAMRDGYRFYSYGDAMLIV
jgi:S-adenosylmethionine:tRNA ribosyltransferase-isomerase